MNQNCINCNMIDCEYYGKNRSNGCRWYKNKKSPKCPYCGGIIEEYTVIQSQQVETKCDNCNKTFLLGVTFIFDYDC